MLLTYIDETPMIKTSPQSTFPIAYLKFASSFSIWIYYQTMISYDHDTQECNLFRS